MKNGVVLLHWPSAKVYVALEAALVVFHNWIVFIPSEVSSLMPSSNFTPNKSAFTPSVQGLMVAMMEAALLPSVTASELSVPEASASCSVAVYLLPSAREIVNSTPAAAGMRIAVPRRLPSPSVEAGIEMGATFDSAVSSFDAMSQDAEVEVPFTVMVAPVRSTLAPLWL